MDEYEIEKCHNCGDYLGQRHYETHSIINKGIRVDPNFLYCREHGTQKDETNFSGNQRLRFCCVVCFVKFILKIIEREKAE